MDETDQKLEVWQPIPEWYAYEASSFGRVRSKDRMIEYKDGRKRFYKSTILNPWQTKIGYLHVELCNGKDDRRGCSVHALVCSAFYGPCPQGLECRHLNDIKYDNRSENLIWGTSKENKADSIRNKTNPMSRGTHNSYSQSTRNNMKIAALKRWSNHEERDRQSKRIKASWAKKP